jgi:hypothetical protein
MFGLSKDSKNDLFIRLLIEYYHITEIRKKIHQLFYKKYDYDSCIRRKIIVIYILWHKGQKENVKNIIESL